jgi:hypothetical protein
VHHVVPEDAGEHIGVPEQSASIHVHHDGHVVILQQAGRRGRR